MMPLIMPTLRGLRLKEVILQRCKKAPNLAALQDTQSSLQWHRKSMINAQLIVEDPWQAREAIGHLTGMPHSRSPRALAAPTRRPLDYPAFPPACARPGQAAASGSTPAAIAPRRTTLQLGSLTLQPSREPAEAGAGRLHRA